MAGSKSSASSPRSSVAALAGVVLLLAAISFAGAWWVFSRGYSLYYGDAEAHLNIARRIVDSRTPGPEQIGTVWLPLPHLLLIPFVTRDSWWRSGLAGAIPSAICFVVAGAFLFAAARRLYDSTAAAVAAALLFALNPNLLYLQATPMTEPLFLAALMALLWSTLWFRDAQSVTPVLAAAVASNAASLTRYEGWFLIPFVTVYLLAIAKRRWLAVLFAAVAAIGPVAWLAHNRYYYGNPLEFYNGPYSAMAIYQRALAQGGTHYPGDHDWLAAARYYFAASRAVAGLPLLILGAAGAVVAALRRAWWPLLFLALAPAFYVWSMHSSGTPIFVPDLPPQSWYNTRYAVAAVPLAALAAGGLVVLLPARLQVGGALIVAAGVAFAWMIGSGPVSICWKESEVNSEVRRTWTQEAAGFLAGHYRPGSGIIFSFGDLTGVLREAGIPLREGLHEGNGVEWNAAMVRPDLFLREEWALAFSGDAVANAIQKAGTFRLRRRVVVKGAPVVEIYHRE
jgi:Dolichyl-phosphate-mannose-protein mannosyltransferase